LLVRRLLGLLEPALNPIWVVLVAGERPASATIVGGPVVTPWNDRNVRLDPPEGVQLTLFTVSDS